MPPRKSLRPPAGAAATSIEHRRQYINGDDPFRFHCIRPPVNVANVNGQ